jgi:hypothetical protein
MLPVPPFRYLPRSGGDARSTPGEIGYFRRNCLVPKVDSLPEVSARDEQAERSEGDHQVDARVCTKEQDLTAGCDATPTCRRSLSRPGCC